MESLEPLYLFVFAHYPTQNRFALLLEILQQKTRLKAGFFHSTVCF
jgi:hypothetical protein